MAQNHVSSYFSCWITWNKNLIYSCERSWIEDAKICIGFVCSSNTSRENQQNAFPKKPWILWCEPNCISQGRRVRMCCGFIEDTGKELSDMKEKVWNYGCAHLQKKSIRSDRNRYLRDIPAFPINCLICPYKIKSIYISNPY